jgi:hypothetical protein
MSEKLEIEIQNYKNLISIKKKKEQELEEIKEQLFQLMKNIYSIRGYRGTID